MKKIENQYYEFNKLKFNNIKVNVLEDNIILLKCPTIENLKKANIAIANIAVSKKDLEKNIAIKKPNLSFERIQQLFKLLNMVANEKCDFFIMPEVSIPLAWLPMMAEYARKHQKVVILG